MVGVVRQQRAGHTERTELDQEYVLLQPVHTRAAGSPPVPQQLLIAKHPPGSGHTSQPVQIPP